MQQCWKCYKRQFMETVSNWGEQSDDHKLVVDNIVTVVKESGEYNKIKKMIDNNEIVPKEIQEQLNSNQSLKELGNIAGKVLLTKYVKNPDKILSLLKKF
ncbi:unnamed protein product [Ranitomeya imitator]|uniref:Uncharacterized protein n=1 Tax=Ranitomeya imitator TaxID=111125 RepID=A0ABN9MEN8_9NEOB|nr:unnamed protein product [Ranitomeya imitator]